jgi:hypothetical protein
VGVGVGVGVGVRVGVRDSGNGSEWKWVWEWEWREVGHDEKNERQSGSKSAGERVSGVRERSCVWTKSRGGAVFGRRSDEGDGGICKNPRRRKRVRAEAFLGLLEKVECEREYVNGRERSSKKRKTPGWDWGATLGRVVEPTSSPPAPPYSLCLLSARVDVGYRCGKRTRD